MLIQRLHTAGASVRSSASCFSRSSLMGRATKASSTACRSPWAYAHVRSRLVDGHGSAHRVGVCNASKQTEVGGYTPADYITYSEDKDMWCTHETTVTIDAPIETVFGYWSDWSKLLEYFDLIGEIGLDPENPDLALLTCYYRWASLPVMELAFILAKIKVQDNRYITFKSEWGMPCSGYVAVGEEEDGQTHVEFVFEHAMPDLLIKLGVGSFGMANALKPAWEEILQELKKLAEAARPANWEAELKPAAAERGKQLEARRMELKQQLAQATEAAKHQEQALEQNIELQTPGGAQQQAQQSEPAPMSSSSSSSSSSPPGAPSSSSKRGSSSRSGTSSRKASSSGAGEASSSGATAAQQPTASAPVPLKRRGRSTRSAAPSEEELAAAAAEPGGGKGGPKAAGGKRASTSSSSAAAAGGDGGDGSGRGSPKPTSKRRTSRKTTTT